MDTEELMKLCESLAYRYKDQNLREDLVSEGLLACYEAKAAGRTTKKDYVGAARRAMNDYVNVKSKAVTIPPTWASRAVSHALSNDEDVEDLEGVKTDTLQSLLAAMRNDSAPVNETDLYTQGAEVDFEQKEYYAYLLNKLDGVLSEDDWKFLLLISDEETTQQEVADILEVSQQTVSLMLRKIQAKAKHFVTKSDLWELRK